MQCRSCGTQLPLEVAYCPTCGAVSPYRVSESGIAPNDPTAASSPYGAPPQAPPPTHYGSPPYGAPQQNPYEPLSPYTVSLSPPPPPPRRYFPMRLIALIVGALLLLLTASGVIYYAVIFLPT